MSLARLRLVLWNLVILAVLLGALELGARAVEPSRRDALWLQPQPFVMFTSRGGHHDNDWPDPAGGPPQPSRLTANRDGLLLPFELSAGVQPPVAPGARVVLWTGGSTAWGLGASRNEATAAARLEALLRAAQPRRGWMVVNLASSGWIARQQLVGLALWGEPFDPAWVVSLDGLNDAMTFCDLGQGVGRPQQWALMRSYLDGYLTSESPVFYRGEAVNALLRASALARLATGQRPIERPQRLDAPGRDGRRQVVAGDALWSDAERQVGQYVQAQRARLALFDRARHLFLLQPTRQPASAIMDTLERASPADQAVLEPQIPAEMERLKALLPPDHPCGTTAEGRGMPWLETALALGARDLARREGALYRWVGASLPPPGPARDRLFVDPVHLSDAGQELVARLAADAILAADPAP